MSLRSQSRDDNLTIRLTSGLKAVCVKPLVRALYLALLGSFVLSWFNIRCDYKAPFSVKDIWGVHYIKSSIVGFMKDIIISNHTSENKSFRFIPQLSRNLWIKFSILNSLEFFTWRNRQWGFWSTAQISTNS